MGEEQAINLDNFISFMKRKGMNITNQRKTIAEKFFSLEGHHSLEEIYHIIAQEDPSIGQTTVYRTLKLLCEAGLATEIHFTDDLTRYEVAGHSTHHDHLICVECGTIIEIYDPSIEVWQKEIAASHGFVLSGHIHNLYGLCSDCRKKKAAEIDIH
ncbi:MAG: transcriptional repressor [Desulfovibrionaceae bacterium]|nr:transcriptional repressor [Desulfovibrionaceae bacterium]